MKFSDGFFKIATLKANILEMSEASRAANAARSAARKAQKAAQQAKKQKLETHAKETLKQMNAQTAPTPQPPKKHHWLRQYAAPIGGILGGSYAGYRALKRRKENKQKTSDRV